MNLVDDLHATGFGESFDGARERKVLAQTDIVRVQDAGTRKAAHVISYTSLERSRIVVVPEIRQHFDFELQRESALGIADDGRHAAGA